MLQLKRLVLDVLKPHHPDVLEFTRAIASQGDDYRVKLDVVEMDDQTQTLEVVVEGTDLQLAGIVDAIGELGGSVHSIDQVEVWNVNEE
jgi:hypothetical protein